MDGTTSFLLGRREASSTVESNPVRPESWEEREREKARTPTTVPTKVKNGLAFFRGAVSVQRFSEGERRHIQSRVTFQRAYGSVDILSNGKPVDGGIDLDKTPLLAGVIHKMTGLVGVRPDCVHMTTREGGQLHTSHSDTMKFHLRGTVHLCAEDLLDEQVDPARSTGDFILSVDDLSQPLRLRMRSRDAYLATDKVLHGPVSRHPTKPASVVCTWSPRRGAFNPFRSKSHPLAESFPSLCGVKAVDGEESFEVTTTDRVPPKKVKARIREPGEFTDGVSLFRAPPEEQASAYHRLGKMRSPNEGEESHRKRKAEDPVKYSEDQAAAGKIGGKGSQGTPISSQGGRRGPGAAGKKAVDISPLRTLIGTFPRAYKKEDGKVAKPTGKSKFYTYKISNDEETLGCTSTVQTVARRHSYPSDAHGNEITATIRDQAA